MECPLIYQSLGKCIADIVFYYSQRGAYCRATTKQYAAITATITAATRLLYYRDIIYLKNKEKQNSYFQLRNHWQCSEDRRNVHKDLNYVKKRIVCLYSFFSIFFLSFQCLFKLMRKGKQKKRKNSELRNMAKGN